MRILMLASEVAPFAKTGGLADVAGSLPKALAALGHDVRVVMPAYTAIEGAAAERLWGIASLGLGLQVRIAGGVLPAGVLQAELPGTRVPVYFIAERSLFARDTIYGYDDDPYRFAFFCRAALDLAVAALGWRPDVVHAHDWHGAAAIWWLGTAGSLDDRYRGIPTVFTIHNLQHQGRTSPSIARYIGIGAAALWDETPGEVNLMARALFHATMISTVSPTYSREILTPQGGAGLDGLLRYRHYDVHGILNGVDVDVWNPATDTRIAARYTAHRLDLRRENTPCRHGCTCRSGTTCRWLPWCRASTARRVSTSPVTSSTCCSISTRARRSSRCWDRELRATRTCSGISPRIIRTR